MYVLMEYEIDDHDNCMTNQAIVGVFDYPDITHEKLAEHYGEFTEDIHLDIHDSGLEWSKVITCDGQCLRLVLHDFEVNEL